MNAATVLVYAALATIVLAKNCQQPCEAYLTDIRNKVGNGGKNASIEVITAVFMKDCDPDPKLKDWCTKYSIRDAARLKAWYDAGKTDKMICEEIGCKNDD